jgi:hypothetical protein
MFETKDSGKRVEYKSGFRRDIQEGKPRFDLIWAPILRRWADLMARGAEKYGENNWKKANTEEERMRFKASAFRHFMAWMEEQEDEDHATAVMFNIMADEYMKNKLHSTNTNAKENT